MGDIKMQVTFYRDRVRTVVRTFDGILVHAICNGYEDDVLDEELEICQELTDKLIKSICNGCVLKDIVAILEEGGSAYEHFHISFPHSKAKQIAAQLWEYKNDVQKYAHLAKQETINYPEKEVKRLKQLEDELKNDLEYADK